MSEARDNSLVGKTSGQAKARNKSRSGKPNSRRNARRKHTVTIVVSASALIVIGFAPRLFPNLVSFMVGLISPPASVVNQPVNVHDDDGHVAVAPDGVAIVNAGAGTVSHTDDHSQSNSGNHSGNSGNSSGNTGNNSGNSGNNSGNDRSVSVTGGTFGNGTVISTGDGDINSNNDNRNFTFHGNVDDKAVKQLMRPTKLTPQQFVARYIDVAMERIPDRPSVALHVLNIAGFETTGIQDAVGAALTNLGYHVPALFRAPFADDGLDKELFRGSAKLADQLQLRQHCDGVLLGEVQIKAANNLQGLFITEASISLHQIAVDSGAVARNIVIRAKGTGLNADASAASALRELEESIKQQLGEWSLT